MHTLRRLILRNRMSGGAILALALLLRIVMPAGFMPTVADGQIIVAICSGSGPATMAMIVPGLDNRKSDSSHSGKVEQPCTFAGLSTSFIAAADPIVLAAAILYIVRLGTRLLCFPTSTAPPHLRPPLRGPPAQI